MGKKFLRKKNSQYTTQKIRSLSKPGNSIFLLIFFSFAQNFDGFLEILVTFIVSIVSPGIQQADEENRLKIAAL